MSATGRWGVETVELEAEWADAEEDQAERAAQPCECARCICNPSPRQTDRWWINGRQVCAACAIKH